MYLCSLQFSLVLQQDYSSKLELLHGKKAISRKNSTPFQEDFNLGLHIKIKRRGTNATLMLACFSRTERIRHTFRALLGDKETKLELGPYLYL